MHKSAHLPSKCFAKITSFLLYSVFSEKIYTTIQVFSGKTWVNLDGTWQEIAIDNKSFLVLI